MIRIHSSTLNASEKQYCWTVLFKDLLKLSTPFEFVVSNDDAKDTIELPNGNYIDCHNDFFKTTYQFSSNHLPTKMAAVENQLICFYGVPQIERSSNSAVLKVDVLGMIFFMLTRWEESLDYKKDKHERFDSKNAFTVKHKIEKRAIVDEWATYIETLMKDIDDSVVFDSKSFKCIPTHDIDSLKKWNGIKDVLEHAWLGIKQKGFFYCLYNLFAGILSLLGLRKDDNDTIEELMELSEQYGFQSYFFFITGGKTKHEQRYSFQKDVKPNMISEIKQRGHYLGLHPSYNSYNNTDIFNSEVEALKQYSVPKYGRQHYLRFEVPITWQLWEKANFEWESTVGFADRLGFRSGTCQAYRVFDIEKKCTLNLKEMPLLIMDQTLINYLKLSPKEALKQSINILETVKEHKGNFVILWHNANLRGSEFGRYKWVYESLLKQCA